MEPDMKKETVFAKVGRIKELLSKELEDYHFNDLKQNIQRLANWQYQSKQNKKKVKLSKQDVILLEILLKHKYNPSTVYRWLLLTEAPEEIRQQLKHKKISLRNALSQKRITKTQLAANEEQLREMVLSCIDIFIEGGVNETQY